jgi:hypothetical protein
MKDIFFRLIPFPLGGTEAKYGANEVRVTRNRFSCFVDQIEHSVCTCRGMSYQQKMIYAVLTGSAILPEVVAKHSYKLIYCEIRSNSDVVTWHLLSSCVDKIETFCFIVTCRRGSYEQNVTFRVLIGSTIWPEVVLEHDPTWRFNFKVDVTLAAFFNSFEQDRDIPFPDSCRQSIYVHKMYIMHFRRRIRVTGTRPCIGKNRQSRVRV